MLKKLLLSCVAAAVVSSFATSPSYSQSAINDAPFVQLPGMLSNPATGDALTPPGGKLAGRYYASVLGVNGVALAVGAANTLYASPMWVGSPSIIHNLSFNITTGIAGAWNARECIYADTGHFAPGALIVNGDSGTVAVGAGSVTGHQDVAMPGGGVPVSGWVWIAWMTDTTGQSLTSYNTSNLQTYALFGIATPANLFGGNIVEGYSGAQTFGACPNNFPSPTIIQGASSFMPLVAVGF